MKDFRKFLPGLLISLISLAIIFYFVDFQALLRALSKADFRLILAGIAVFAVSLIARARAWKTLLLDQVSTARAAFTICEGYLLNNILPFRLGEIARALIMSGTTGLGFWQVLSTILIERAFDLILAAGIVLATLPFVFQVSWAAQASAVVVVVVIGGLFFLYLLARNRDRSLAYYDRLCARWPALVRLGRDRISSFFTGLAVLTDFRRFLKAFGWLALVWGLTLVEYYLFLLAFVPEAEPLWAAFSLGVLALGVAVPSAPASLGVYEASLVGGLLAFGVDPAVALAYAITTHLLFVLLTGSVGVFAFVRDGLLISRLYRDARAGVGQGASPDA